MRQNQKGIITMAPVSDPSTALRSEALDAFLDHVDTLFNTEDETQEWPARQAAAVQQLASRALEPEEDERLHERKDDAERVAHQGARLAGEDGGGVAHESGGAGGCRSRRY